LLAPILAGVAAVVALLALGALIGPRFFGSSSSSAASTPTAVAAKPTTATGPVAANTPPATARPTVQPTLTAGVGAAAKPAASPAAPAAPDPKALLANAQAALTSKNWNGALEQANAGLQIDPRNVDLAQVAVQSHLALADQLWSQGNSREALLHFLPVREQPLRAAAKPDQLRQAELAAPYIWGDLMWDTDLTTAMKELEKVYRIDPSYRQVQDKLYSGYITQADQAIQRGDTDSATKILTTAKQVNPNRPEAQERLQKLAPGGRQ
jgi:tetratricopeptide (TPR) repeat protein